MPIPVADSISVINSQKSWSPTLCLDLDNVFVVFILQLKNQNDQFSCFLLMFSHSDFLMKNLPIDFFL